MPDPPNILPGTPAGKLPTFSAGWINNVSAMLRWFNRMVASGDQTTSNSAMESTSGRIKIKNLAGHDLLRGHYVQLGDYLLDKVNHRQHWYEGNLYDAGENGRIAVLEEASKSGSSVFVRARIIGRCTARVNVTDITHRFAEPDDGEYLLKSAAASGIGDIEILSTNLITDTGEQEVAVVIGGGGAGGGTVKRGVAKATATIGAASGDTATTSTDFTVFKGDDPGTLYNYAAATIAIGQKMPWVDIDGESVIYNAFC